SRWPVTRNRSSWRPKRRCRRCATTSGAGGRTDGRDGGEVRPVVRRGDPRSPTVRGAGDGGDALRHRAAAAGRAGGGEGGRAGRAGVYPVLRVGSDLPDYPLLGGIRSGRGAGDWRGT